MDSRYTSRCGTREFRYPYLCHPNPQTVVCLEGEKFGHDFSILVTRLNVAWSCDCQGLGSYIGKVDKWESRTDRDQGSSSVKRLLHVKMYWKCRLSLDTDLPLDESNGEGRRRCICSHLAAGVSALLRTNRIRNA